MDKSKIKVGILTFHEVFNPGAFLQAYATQELLRSLGYNPVIIDYNPKRHRYHPLTHGLRMHYRFPKNWRIWLDCITSNRVYVLARRKYLNLTSRFTTRSALATEAFDVVIVGSDIVWNYELKRLGRDPVYFGEGLNTKRLIAFAPSCGACDKRGMIPDYVTRNLPKFDSISVRDDDSATIVSRAIGEAVPVICDPTFHLKSKLRAQAATEPKSKQERILVYLLHGMASNRLVRDIKTLSQREGLPIHAVVYGYDWADENMMSLDPFEWIDAIRSSRYFVTNTFHGTLFAVLTAANFVVELNPEISSKTEAFIQNAGLSGRLYGMNSTLPGLFQHELQYSVPDAYMDAQAKASMDYLIRSLGGSAETGE